MGHMCGMLWQTSQSHENSEKPKVITVWVKPSGWLLQHRFQHRTSAHAHFLLWLDNAPEEEGEHKEMPETFALAEYLISLDVPLLKRGSCQTYQHNHTCYKRDPVKLLCRFGALFWPMRSTRILYPLNKEVPRCRELKSIFKRCKTHWRQWVMPWSMSSSTTTSQMGRNTCRSSVPDSADQLWFYAGPSTKLA